MIHQSVTNSHGQSNQIPSNLIQVINSVVTRQIVAILRTLCVPRVFHGANASGFAIDAHITKCIKCVSQPLSALPRLTGPCTGFILRMTPFVRHDVYPLRPLLDKIGFVYASRSVVHGEARITAAHSSCRWVQPPYRCERLVITIADNFADSQDC